MSNYPLVKFHFQVEWGGSSIAFSEVTGLNTELETIEYRDGASKEYTPLKMPGLQKYSNITLKRGSFAEDNEFFQWLNTVKLNQIERRDLIISLLNENHEPVVVWKVKNAWPVKIQSPALQADNSEVAIESIEIAHEGLTIEYA